MHESLLTRKSISERAEIAAACIHTVLLSNKTLPEKTKYLLPDRNYLDGLNSLKGLTHLQNEVKRMLGILKIKKVQATATAYIGKRAGNTSVDIRVC